MRQVLFWIPIKSEGFPDGVPVYAYGAMLFVAFVACVWFAVRRAKRTGIQVPRERFQDLGIAVFIFGLIGARLVFMWQAKVPLSKFYRIWEGGIVLYGGIIGGVAAFMVFHRLVLRRFHVTLWQMADLAAPCVALGIALGRVGCLLNGCCWGQPACASCPDIQFPLLTSPARSDLIDRDALQTPLGYVAHRGHLLANDSRTVVDLVEPGSAAEQAGLRPGDRIVRFRYASDWINNSLVLAFTTDGALPEHAARELRQLGQLTFTAGFGNNDVTYRLAVENREDIDLARQILLRNGIFGDVRDQLNITLQDWPRGRNSIQFTVLRDGAEIELPAFTPRTIGFHPTQFYEVVSMVLLLVLLLAFYPFRRHDGQVWVLFMFGYAIHRFLNEILRTEPIELTGLTLSQAISIAVVAAAVGIEIFLRKTQPRRVAVPPGQQGTAAVARS